MDSIIAGYIHSRNLAKVSESACGIGGQVMMNASKLPDTARFEAMIPPNVLTRPVEGANAVRTTITPPSELDEIRMLHKALQEKLLFIGLSDGALDDILSLYTSKFGTPRTKALEMIIFWHAGIPVPPDDAIELLAKWISPDLTAMDTEGKLKQIIMRCLLIERCAFELTLAYGDDWFDRSPGRVSCDLNVLNVGQIMSEVMAICNATFHSVMEICLEIMHIVTTHDELQALQTEKKHLLLEQEQHQERLEQLKNAIEEATDLNRRNNQQERFLSQNGITNEFIINALRRSQNCHGRDERHNHQATLQNFVSSAIAAGDVNSYNTRIHNMMQQLCMQQPPFGS